MQGRGILYMIANVCQEIKRTMIFFIRYDNMITVTWRTQEELKPALRDQNSQMSLPRSGELGFLIYVVIC
jgi:hypothetical protein